MPDLQSAWPIEIVNSMTLVFQHMNASDVIFIFFCILNEINIVFIDPSPALLTPIMYQRSH